MGIGREGSGSAPLIRLCCLIGKEETCVGRGVTLPVPLLVRPGGGGLWTQGNKGEVRRHLRVSSRQKPNPRREGEAREGISCTPSPSAQLGKTRPREKTVMPKVAEGMRKLVQRADCGPHQ